MARLRGHEVLVGQRSVSLKAFEEADGVALGGSDDRAAT